MKTHESISPPAASQDRNDSTEGIEPSAPNVLESSPLANAGPVNGHIEFGPVERLSLQTVLKDLTSRLTSVESSLLEVVKGNRESRGNKAVELFRIVFGGWPAFAFVFLVLFYSPLHDALNAIPARVKAGDDIQLPGLSLKSTIKQIATSQGLEGLGETIPKLSSSSIELLLRAPKRSESLVSYTNSRDFKTHTAINFPSEQVVKALIELQAKGLIDLKGGMGTPESLDAAKLDQLSRDYKNKFPGFPESNSGDDRTAWKLNSPLPVGDSKDLPMLMWSLSESGLQAVDVIIKAVSRQLLQSDPTEAR